MHAYQNALHAQKVRTCVLNAMNRLVIDLLEIIRQQKSERECEIRIPVRNGAYFISAFNFALGEVLGTGHEGT